MNRTPEIEIIRRKQQKRIIVRKTDKHRLRVSAPVRTPMREIRKVLKTYEEQIMNLPVKPDFHIALRKPKTLTIFGARLPVFYQNGPSDVTIAADRIVVVSPKDDAATIKNLLEQALKHHLLKTTHTLHDKMRQQHPELEKCHPDFYTRYTLSRFGSCNKAKNRINLNLALVHYPVQCLHSVYAHEVTHLFVAGHSRAFYEQLAVFDPEYKANKLNLEAYHRIYLRDNATSI